MNSDGEHPPLNIEPKNFPRRVGFQTHEAFNETNPFYRVSVNPSHILESIDSKYDIQESSPPDFPIKFCIYHVNNADYLTLFPDIAHFDNEEQKYSHIYHVEKSFELAHFAISRIAYFSRNSPKILYELPLEVTKGKVPIFLNSLNVLYSLTESQIQIVLMGICSGLSYLFQKGYAIPNFSLDNIYLDCDRPKLLGFVNYKNLKYVQEIENFRDDIAEIDIVKCLPQVIIQILNKGLAQPNETLVIPSNTNSQLQQMLEAINNSPPNNWPTLQQFADFFMNNNYAALNNVDEIEEYKAILAFTDYINYRDLRSRMFEYQYFNPKNRDQIIFNESLHGILESNMSNIPAYLFPQDNFFREATLFPFLNRIPEHYIKNLVQSQNDFAPILMREMLFYDRHDLLLRPKSLENLKNYKRKPFIVRSPEDEYEIYQKIINFAIQNGDSKAPFGPIAIMHLKKAAKSGHRNAMLILAKQYYKGKMIPANYEKALEYLSNQIFKDDPQVAQFKARIQQKLDEIEEKLNQKINGTNEDNAIWKLYNEAKEGTNPIIIIYVAFAFYTGLDGFPQSTSHAVKFYRKAAKLSPDYLCLLGILYYRGIIFPRNLNRAQNCFKLASVGNRYEDHSQVNVTNSPETSGNKERSLKKRTQSLNLINKSEIVPIKKPQQFTLEQKPIVRHDQETKRPLRFSCSLDSINEDENAEVANLGGSFKAKILDGIFRKHLWRTYLLYKDSDIDVIIDHYLQCPASMSYDDSMILPTAVYLTEKTQIPYFYDSPQVQSYYYYDERNYYKNLKRSEIKLDLRHQQYKLNELLSPFGQSELSDLPFTIISHLQNVDVQVHSVNEKELEESNEKSIDSGINFLSKFFLTKTKKILRKLDDLTYKAFAGSDDDDENQIDALKQLQDHFSLNDTPSTEVSYQIGDTDENLIHTIEYFPSILIPKADRELESVTRKLVSFLCDSKQELEEKLKDKTYVDHSFSRLAIEYRSVFDKNQKNKVNKQPASDSGKPFFAPKQYLPANASKICLSPELNKYSNSTNHLDDLPNSPQMEQLQKDEGLFQLKIANCYYDGLCGYPVNYNEAARFYKMSADNGSSEAQWKYAQMCANGLGTRQDPEEAQKYFVKSVDNKDPEGMLRYALFIRHFLINSSAISLDLPPFQSLLEQSAYLGNIEANHQLGICYESNYSGTDEIYLALERYQEAAESGHIESFTRLAQLVQSLDTSNVDEKFRNYPKYSIGLFNTELMLNYIDNLHAQKLHEEAKKIIDIGMKIKPKIFAPYLAENIALIRPNPGPDEFALANRYLDAYLKPDKYAKDKKKSENSLFNQNKLTEKYEKYVMTKLKVLLASSFDHRKIVKHTLLPYQDCLSLKSKYDFIDFYKQLDKNVAREFLITVSFYLPDCREITEPSKNLKKNNKKIHIVKKMNIAEAIDQLKYIVEVNPSNSFALLELGKVYLKGIWFKVLRDPKKAINYIQQAAIKDTPEARFVCGKVYYYGYDCDPDTEKSFDYFWKAFDNGFGDPRAGYYLAKKRFLTKDDATEPNKFTKDIVINENKQKELLKTAADFGYRRALFKIGKDEFENFAGDVKLDGYSKIVSAYHMDYKKAKKYVDSHPDQFQDLQNSNPVSRNESMLNLESGFGTKSTINLSPTNDDDKSDNSIWSIEDYSK